MKAIKKSFKVIWYPLTKHKKKSYRINVFKKDGTFKKMYLNGKVYAKGKYTLYKIEDMNFVTFVGKKKIHNRWKDFVESAVVKFTSQYQKYNIVSIPSSHSSGMVRIIDNNEYNRYIHSRGSSRRRSRGSSLRRSHGVSRRRSRGGSRGGSRGSSRRRSRGGSRGSSRRRYSVNSRRNRLLGATSAIGGVVGAVLGDDTSYHPSWNDVGPGRGSIVNQQNWVDYANNVVPSSSWPYLKSEASHIMDECSDAWKRPYDPNAPGCKTKWLQQPLPPPPEDCRSNIASAHGRASGSVVCSKAT